MTKAELYRKAIDIQKSSGQGLSGIVKIKSQEISVYMDELIDEGLIVCMDTGGSLGHSESNKFYMPSEGYNVWRDGVENGNGHTNYLTFVRFYLGCLNEREGANEIQRALHPTMKACAKDYQFMTRYLEWLGRNEAQLKIMMELDDTYIQSDMKLDKEFIDWVKTRSWYKKNKTIKECRTASMEQLGLIEQIIKLTKEMLQLLSREQDKKLPEINKYEKKLEEEQELKVQRKILHRWFMEHDDNTPIQDCTLAPKEEKEKVKSK